jgi:hypothetical protein
MLTEIRLLESAVIVGESHGLSRLTYTQIDDV